MCGISGIISKSNAPIPEERIKRINNLVGHRGPDGEGYYFGSNFAFGHRRLAILDLSDDLHLDEDAKELLQKLFTEEKKNVTTPYPYDSLYQWECQR